MILDNQRKKQLSQEKINNNISNLYTYKKIFYKKEKNNFSKNKSYNENKNNSSKTDNYTLISEDKKLYISFKSIKLKLNNYKKYKDDIKYENIFIISKFSFKIINNVFIFDKNKMKEIYKNRYNNDMKNIIKNKIKIYNHIKNKSFSKKYNSFLLKSEQDPEQEQENPNESLNIRQSLNSNYQQKIKVKKKKKNIYNIQNNAYNNKNKINDYKNIIINFQDNKYLKGCINFLIKAIKKVILNIFIYLRMYPKYDILKNSIIKLNNKKIKKYYLTQFKKSVKETKNIKNTTKINNNNNNINNIIKANKNYKKIIFNSHTKRYELVNV